VNPSVHQFPFGDDDPHRMAGYVVLPPPRRPATGRFTRRFAATLLGASLVACSSGGGDVAETGTRPPTTTTSTSTTAASTIPEEPGELSASIEQGRPYVARDLLELFLRNDAQVSIEVAAFRLVDPRFAELGPTARDVAIPPGLGPRSMPMPYGAVDCSDGLADGTAVVEVTMADGTVLPVPVDQVGQAFLDAFHADKCQLQQLGEVVSLRWSTPVTSVDAATIRLPLVVERRSGDEPITVEEVGGTVVFADRLVDPGAVPVTLGPGASRVEIAVELSAARCEAHALTESNKTFRFAVWVSIGDQPSHRVEVLPDGEPMAALEQAMQAGCFGTLD
jgi:hypothetical protein